MDLDDIDAALADLTEDQLKELDDEMDPEVGRKKENARQKNSTDSLARARAPSPSSYPRAIASARRRRKSRRASSIALACAIS